MSMGSHGEIHPVVLGHAAETARPAAKSRCERSKVTGQIIGSLFGEQLWNRRLLDQLVRLSDQQVILAARLVAVIRDKPASNPGRIPDPEPGGSLGLLASRANQGGRHASGRSRF
jgi:hypothetical protein